MKNKTILYIIGFIIILIAVKMLFFPSKDVDAGKKQMSAKPTVNVSVFVVNPTTLPNNLLLSGSILPNEEIIIKPEVSGKVMQLNFQEGGAVHKGDLLVKLNDADLKATALKYEGQLKLAKEKEARYKELLSVNGVSKQEYENALNTVQSISADLSFTNAQIAKTEIKAPFDGVIGLRKISEGEIISPNTEISRLQQTDPVKIDFSVPEKYSALVKKGDPVYYYVEGNANKHEGTVFAIEPRISEDTRTLNVRALSENKKGMVIPGAFAKVELILEEKNAIVVPTESIIPELKGKKVFVVKDGKAETRKVKTGLRTENLIEVTEGLQAGDSVVTAGLMQIKDGVDVKIVEVKK